MMTLTLVSCNGRPSVECLITCSLLHIDILKEDGNGLSLKINGKPVIETVPSICRFLGRSQNSSLCGHDPLSKTEVDHWIEFSKELSCSKADLAIHYEYLNKALAPVTYLVGHAISLADVFVWTALAKEQSWLSGSFKNVKRYFCMLTTQPEFDSVRSFVPKISLPAAPYVDIEAILKMSLPADKVKVENKNKGQGKAEVQGDVKKGGWKEEGKFIDLEGAEVGKVVVRFPPEASGYLHVGHAKAALLNQYYQETFEGKLIMRFDDTNPAKESSVFEQVILDDLKLLGIKPDRFTHTSDLFVEMMSKCELLIRRGKAFVDDTNPEEMKKERDERADSKRRDNSLEENLRMWEEMKNGSEYGKTCCVRAKMSMKSDNGCLRDPTIYRCKDEEHVRTGFRYKVYPTYDFACPIVDSLEGVTHALRTTEYHDRDDQYNWFIEQMELRPVHVWEYSRLNLQHTVMSKRKLTWFVEQGLVDGWDDPRLPTVRGVMRRGMTMEGLKKFVIAQGSSRSVNMMGWDKIWAVNKKVIDPIVPRFCALSKGQMVKVKVADAVERTETVQKHPKEKDVGTKTIYYGPDIWVEGADAETLREGEAVTLINWGNARVLRIDKDQTGRVTFLELKLNLEDKDFKNTTKLTWLCDNENVTPAVAVHYGDLITKDILSKDDDFRDFVNKDSKSEESLVGEPDMSSLKKGEIIQLMRRGYFICDSPFVPPSRHSGRESPCILINIPDGHTKEMKTVGSKHKAEDLAKNGGKTVSAIQSLRADEICQTIVDQGCAVRKLKTEKADKSVIDAAVKLLLSLKAEYKQVAGSDWKPGAVPASQPQEKSSSHAADEILLKIADQGSKVRELKSAKADKGTVDAAVKILLELKAEYKKATGEDWKPGMVAAPQVAKKEDPGSMGSDGNGILEKIAEQGNKVRELKSAKADKATVDAAVKILLELKAEFKKATGEDWKPGMVAAPQLVKKEAPGSKSSDCNGILEKIAEQGNKVRELKSAKADKKAINDAVQILLALKAEYEKVTGKTWTPGLLPRSAPVSSPHSVSSKGADDLQLQIKEQGNKVEELKAPAAVMSENVEKLPKAEYKGVTGEDLKGGSKGKKAGKKGSAVKDKVMEDQSAGGESKNLKKQTRLGLEATKEDDLPTWYSQVITKSEMIEYYDVSGCYVLRPWSYSLWEKIQSWFDEQIKAYGVQNCYFPIFVSKSALEKEKEHIEDFAPEVAWVTKSGESQLAEPIAIRPTSETVMYPAFARWLKSHRDLPIKLNQWCNVVRWEFKHPQPFLRTREFLWQEGHSAYATQKEAVDEVYWILERYAEVYEKLLAVPVVRGRKTEKEKFAGGDFTTTIEAYISATGRAIQAATSHHLGQNFSKMFDISFEDPVTQEKSLVYQNSWGLTTRSIGVIVMVHGDNKGLVLPPRVANFQVVVVPCGISVSMKAVERDHLLSECSKLNAKLMASGIRSHVDLRDNVSPGWKFNHWELKGVPIRAEVGPKDLAASQFVAVRRDNGEKSSLPMDDCAPLLLKELDAIQDALYAKAKLELDANIARCEDFDSFCKALDRKKLILAPFCGEISCEENIKKLSARDAVVEEGAPAMGAKGLCIPFEQPEDVDSSLKCVCPDCPSRLHKFTLFGRSY